MWGRRCFVATCFWVFAISGANNGLTQPPGDTGLDSKGPYKPSWTFWYKGSTRATICWKLQNKMNLRQNMSQLCLKRLSYGHWHLNEKFQYVFWLQRRIPLESTIKCIHVIRTIESQSWLCLIIACLAIFRKKYVIFQFWTGKAIKQQSASDNLQKSRSGVQTPLCAPCLETPTFHIFYITTVIHIWFDIFIQNLSCWQWSCYNQ